MTETLNEKSTRRVLITVHGIRTFGQWQERLGKLFNEHEVDSEIEHFKYGYFSIFAFLFPPLRWLAVNQFLSSLTAALERYPAHRISLVGHSNGTYLIAWALNKLPGKYVGRVETVILAGSVLRTDFPWNQLIDRLKIDRVINDCGTGDNILILSQVGVLFTGMAGRLGFRGMTGRRLINRYFKGGHSHYFEPVGDNASYFMEEYWVPVLKGGEATLVDQRQGNSDLSGLQAWLLQNADFSKGAAYSLMIYIFINFLYLEPRMAAETTKKINAVQFAVSAFSDEQFPERGLAELAINFSPKERDLGNNIELLSYYLPRFVDIRDIFKKSGLFRVDRRESETYMSTGTTVRRLDVDPENPIWPLENIGFISVSRDNDEIDLIPDKGYLASTLKSDIRNLEYTLYLSGDWAKPVPSEIRTLSGRITGGPLLLPVRSNANVVRFIFPFQLEEGQSPNEEEGYNSLLVTYELKTGAASALILPGSSDNQLSSDCSTLLYGGYDIWNMVVSLSDEQLKSISSEVYEKRDHLFIPVIEFSNNDGPKERISYLTLEQARKIDWDRNDGFIEQTNECRRRAKIGSSNSIYSAYGYPFAFQFPSFLDEANFWVRADSTKFKPIQRGYKFVTGEDRKLIEQRVRRIVDALPQGTAESEQHVAQDISLLLSLTYVSYRESGDYLFLMGQSNSQNFGISSWAFATLNEKKKSASIIGGVANTYDTPITTSAGGRYAVIRTERELSGKSAIVIDTNEPSELDLDLVHAQYTIAQAFSSDESKVAILGSDGNLVIGSLPDGNIVSSTNIRSSTFKPPGHSFTNEVAFSTMAFVGPSVEIVTQAKSLYSINAKNGAVNWWSKPFTELNELREARLASDENAGLMFLHDDKVGRLISSTTGDWLSGPINVANLVDSANEDCFPGSAEKTWEEREAQFTISSVSFNETATIGIKIGKCWFTRKPPLSIEKTLKTFRDVRFLLGEDLKIDGALGDSSMPIESRGERVVEWLSEERD
ncbi:hypothetical protein VV867_25285 [Pseudomonas sp. JH-2]|uniref:hypothetical protein n=1 Tax=Pseudomonas sp. JH-2 TaxID=3114998 RepID=UPI002E25C108|nr:hypothetical protein [Pseudomonas sp. JH-2]